MARASEIGRDAQRAGPRDDFDAFVLHRSNRLLRTAYLLTFDAHSAEDLVQVALTKAWFAWKRIDGDPEAYVRRILFNSFASQRRRRWNWERPTENLPDQSAADSGTNPDLRQALEGLPPRQRAVIVLRYFEDLTEQDTARTLGINVGTVKSQTAKALARLRIDPLLEEQR